MTLLLVLSAVLFVVSGLVKLRAGERAGLGVLVIPLLETMAGLALAVPLVFGWRPRPQVGLLVVVGAVVIVLTSSLYVGAVLARRRRSRADSEGARLVTYVKYLSRQGPPDG